MIPKRIEIEEVNTLINFFREAGVEDAIIAGGCVRDYVCGKPIKDIDVFCSGKYSPIVKNIVGVSLDLACAYQNIPDVDCVWNMDVLSEGAMPIQIIAMEGDMTPIERIGTFDWGLCQVWYDGEIKYTENFLKDFQNKTMTLVYCENQHEWKRSHRRAERLLQKYGDYSIVSKPMCDYPLREVEQNVVNLLSGIAGGFSICPSKPGWRQSYQ